MLMMATVEIYSPFQSSGEGYMVENPAARAFDSTFLAGENLGPFVLA